MRLHRNPHALKTAAKIDIKSSMPKHFSEKLRQEQNLTRFKPMNTLIHCKTGSISFAETNLLSLLRQDFILLL